MAAFIGESHDLIGGSKTMKGSSMKPLKIAKGACTVVGAMTLAATVLMVGLYAFTSFQLPREELTSLKFADEER